MNFVVVSSESLETSTVVWKNIFILLAYDLLEISDRDGNELGPFVHQLLQRTRSMAYCHLSTQEKDSIQNGLQSYTLVDTAACLEVDTSSRTPRGMHNTYLNTLIPQLPCKPSPWTPYSCASILTPHHHLSPRISQPSQNLLTPNTAARPSFLSSFPPTLGSPKIFANTQNPAATHAAKLTPKATKGANTATMISVGIELGGRASTVS